MTDHFEHVWGFILEDLETLDHQRREMGKYIWMRPQFLIKLKALAQHHRRLQTAVKPKR